MAAAATDRSLDKSAVLSSPCLSGERLLRSTAFGPFAPLFGLRLAKRSERLFGILRLDLLEGGLGVAAFPAVTEVVRLVKSRSKSGPWTCERAR